MNSSFSNPDPPISTLIWYEHVQNQHRAPAIERIEPKVGKDIGGDRDRGGSTLK